MNIIGKTMVLLYTVMALSCLMWATTIFTNRVDWAPPKDAPPAPKDAKGSALLGKVDKAHARIVELDLANERAIKRWVANTQIVKELEQDRLARRNFYAARLEIALTGKLGGAEVKKPYRELPKPDETTGLYELTMNEATGLPELDFKTNEDTGKLEIEAGKGFDSRPAVELRPGIPVLSGSAYIGKIEAADKAILETQDDILKLIKEHEIATKIINSEQRPGILKGLRQLIKDQIAIQKIALDQREYLNDYITNRFAEGQLFIKRKALLEARIKELSRIRRGSDGNMD